MKKLNNSFSLIVLTILIGLLFTQCNTPAWYQRSDVLVDRIYSTASWGVDPNNNLTIYAIGGKQFNAQPAGVEGFHPNTNTWQQYSGMNIPRKDHASVTYYSPGAPIVQTRKGVSSNTSIKIYVFGGTNSGSTSVINSVEEYDTRTDTWVQKTPFSTPRRNLAAASANNGKIYIFGGSNANESFIFDSVEEYDPATDTWVTKTAMPEKRFGLAAATGSDGKIYVTGGIGPGKLSNDNLWIYNPNADSWSIGTNLPYKIAHHASTGGHGSKIFVLGGKQPAEYDINSSSWSLIPYSICGSRSDAASTSFFVDIYFIGGVKKLPPQPSSCVEVYSKSKY